MHVIETDDLIVFNWIEASHEGELQVQLDGVLDAMNDVLREVGVPFSAMLKHTIAIRNGAVDPLAAIYGFHARCHALGPELREHPSVGTIFRVPGFAQAGTLVALEAVFAKSAQGIRRVLFEDMDMDVARALDDHGTLFLTGFEALELLNPELGFDSENREVREPLAEQVDVVLDKIDASLKGLDADCSMLQRLSLYLREDQDPVLAQQLVRAAAEKRAGGALPQLQFFVLRGHGMVMDSFKIEIDGLALRTGMAGPGWASFTCGQGRAVNDTVVVQAAKLLAQKLAPTLKQAPRGVQVLLKHTGAGVNADAVPGLLAGFEAALRQGLSVLAPAQLSLAMLRVNALVDQSAALEVDATVFL